MFTDTKRRTAAMLTLGALAGMLLTGCGQSLTDPTSRRAIRSADAQHDDDPSECRSGYIVIEGRIVCN